LGLAIVRELVRRHGGNVTATEAPDGWCRFLVTLPVAEGSSVDDSPMVPV
jgi:signal transduction histidine kinase